MASDNENLHGNAPDKADVALLLIDVINDLNFPEGEQLLRYAVPMAEHLLALKCRSKKAGIPVVYVNDNFGRWRSNFTSQVEHCLNDNVRGKPLVEMLIPDPDDYFVLKVRVHTLVDNCPRMTPRDGQTLMLGNAVKTRAGTAPARFSVPDLLHLDSPCRRPKTHGAT
ncbi:MAG TPA: isochorismatase family protein [Isosphaeraceae bacterium]|nr:isochorismatase family protein [Isosphaeraceae bacterium]